MKQLRTGATVIGALLILSVVFMDYYSWYRLMLGLLMIFTSLACTPGADGNTWDWWE